jgi:hypothetical protein
MPFGPRLPGLGAHFRSPAAEESADHGVELMKFRFFSDFWRQRTRDVADAIEVLLAVRRAELLERCLDISFSRGSRGATA